MSEQIDYEFVFQTQFTESVYTACTAVASNANFQAEVQEAVSNIIVILRRFGGLARMSKLLRCDGKTYKVTVNRPV